MEHASLGIMEQIPMYCGGGQAEALHNWGKEGFIVAGIVAIIVAQPSPYSGFW